MSVLNKTTAQQDQQYLVKVSSADESAGYLLDKLSAGTGITITKINSGDNEQVQIGLNTSGMSIVTNKVSSDASGTEGYLGDVLGIKSNSTDALDLEVDGDNVEIEFTAGLDELNDCSISSVSAGDLIQRNAGNTDFENVSVETALPALSVIGDVVGTPVQFDVLVRNGTGSWENTPMKREDSDALSTVASDTIPCSELLAQVRGGTMTSEEMSATGSVNLKSSIVVIDTTVGNVTPSIDTWNGRKITLFKKVSGNNIVLSGLQINGSAGVNLEWRNASITMVYNVPMASWLKIAHEVGVEPA